MVVAILTTSGTVSDENVIKIKTFTSQWLAWSEYVSDTVKTKNCNTEILEMKDIDEMKNNKSLFISGNIEKYIQD